METNELSERASLIGVLAETFRQTVSKSLLTGYAMGLEGIPTDRLKAAVRTALRTCKFMPTPVELRELSGEMKLGDRAVRAFMVMENAVTTIGGYSTVDFDDRFINAAVRALGGWVSVCEAETADFDKFMRQKFERAYVALVTAGIGDEQAEPLQGRHDRSNSIGGYDRQQVKLIATGLPRLPNDPGEQRQRIAPPQAVPLRLSRPPAETVARIPDDDTMAIGNILKRQIEAKRIEQAKLPQEVTP